MEKQTRYIAKCPLSYSMCTGCSSCEMVCSLVHEQNVSPKNSRLSVQLATTKTMMYDVLTCYQCEDHPCYNACPLKDKAMCIDENSIVYVEESACIGCGKCQWACKFVPSRITLLGTGKTRKAKKCDLCRTRPEGPACVEWCPARCLAVSGDGLLPWESEALDEPEVIDMYALSTVDTNRNSTDNKEEE